MDWLIIALLSGAASPTKPCQVATCTKDQPLRATARILRAGKGDKESVVYHPAHRLRKIYDVQPNGQRVEVIVLDFE